MFVRLCVCVCVCVFVLLCVFMCVHVCACVFVCVYVYMMDLYGFWSGLGSCGAPLIRQNGQCGLRKLAYNFGWHTYPVA